jgi:hypothetical protein
MNILVVILTLVGVIVAILALGYQRNQAESTRRQEEAARDATRRREVGVAEWMRDLRDWASEAIDVLSEVGYASDSSDVRRYISQLSALVDRGRLFLPNPINKEDASGKPLAFQGSRHRALNPLMAALRVLDGDVENDLTEYVSKNRSDVIWKLRREFVSYIQQILDPRQRNLQIKQLIERSNEQVLALEGGVGKSSKKLLRGVVNASQRKTDRAP